MHILLLTLYFAPDLAANAVIISELAEELAALGHDVTAVAAFPHYDQNRIWDRYQGKLVQRDQDGAIKVYRTYLYVPQRKERIAFHTRRAAGRSLQCYPGALAAVDHRPERLRP
jgi:colanic acid biosynthesis glycosyl transferase WcaI